MRVCVGPDTCSAATAARARSAGATVWERHDAALRGRGHALAFGFEASRIDGRASAVVVVDADSVVSPNLLEAIAARLQTGAEAVQVRHGVHPGVHPGVRHPLASWRTRLMAMALGAFDRVRSRGRERLGLSCGIRGNGWCVTHALLRRVPYRAGARADDVEFGVALGLAGVRVHAVDEAEVDATRVAGAATARTPRQRWASGRWQLLRAHVGPLLRAHPHGHGTRRVCLDQAVDLLVPPLSWLVLGVALLGAVAGSLLALSGVGEGALMLALACALALTLYMLRGWQLSGVGWRGLVDLARAPPLLRVRTPHERP
jgi:cellulose synthase/poly-beta-1,6-N-acetylglucosamine synthase-like glycosyltransferase